jgi:cytoskeletal protein RodZ
VSIGEALAEARRRADLTVTEVSRQTRIRETIITGIEGNDYSACGGDLYVRGYIRSIAQAVGADPEPLIREYDTAQLAPRPIADDWTEPVPPVRKRRRLRLSWIAALVLVWLGVAAYNLLAGPLHTTSATPAATAHPVTRSPTAAGTQAPATPSPANPATPASAGVRKLTPAGAAAFNPSGAGQGDHSELAHLAIDGKSATAWRTDWYTTARFGNLYPGTGLLVDMGKATTITAARITLGRADGADFQLRVGTAPAMADLSPVAHAANTGGVVRLRLSSPAHGRYVLIWFTSLPPDSSGTFQVSVYNVRLEGPA